MIAMDLNQNFFQINSKNYSYDLVRIVKIAYSIAVSFDLFVIRFFS